MGKFISIFKRNWTYLGRSDCRIFLLNENE